MFNKLDILTFGIAATAIALCALGAVVGQKLTAQLVSAGTGLTFLVCSAALVVMKVSAWSADFVTRRGIRVRFGSVNRPTLAQVEGWTDALLKKLRKRFIVTPELDGVMVVFVDSDKMSVFGRWVRGYADGRVAVIGSTGTAGLFGHEVGHIALLRLGVEWDEAKQHAILAELGL